MELPKQAVFLMFVSTDNTAYMLAQSTVLLHTHPEWLRELDKEQDRLVAEHGPELGRKVRCTAALPAAAPCSPPAHPARRHAAPQGVLHGRGCAACLAC